VTGPAKVAGASTSTTRTTYFAGAVEGGGGAEIGATIGTTTTTTIWEKALASGGGANPVACLRERSLRGALNSLRPKTQHRHLVSSWPK